jgi:hypothetical protein
MRRWLAFVIAMTGGGLIAAAVFAEPPSSSPLPTGGDRRWREVREPSDGQRQSQAEASGTRPPHPSPLPQGGEGTATDFDSRVAPILARRCLGCHNASDRKGGLDLSGRKAALTGGDSGEVIAPGKPDDSLLIERIDADEMPPKKPLPADEKRLLREWVAGGAKWGADPIDVFRFSSENRAGYDWWALQPIQRPTPPKVNDAAWVTNPIDNFILSSLETKGLTHSPLADRRALIRRLSFDLLGLPPTPEEVSAFVADPDPRAYEKLVDRYLASPHYGERWGRHWLDVVRFGESQGFERDKLRANSWQYRDWVIAAFNSDMPYDEFVRQQLAGDVLQPNDPTSVIATGFLVAAAWDEVGQSQQSAAMKAVVRQDEMEDYVAVVCQSFLGLTANCARCHDHKFDPITQREYYRLSAALAGIRHGERESLSDLGRVKAEQRRAAAAERLPELRQQLAEIDNPVRQRLLAAHRESARLLGAAGLMKPPQPISRWNFDGDLRDGVGQLHGTAHGGARVEAGRLLLDGKDAFVATAPLDKPLKEKTLEVWVSLANLDQRGGAAISVQTLDGVTFDAIVFGEREPKKWMAGSNGFVRTQSFDGPDETLPSPYGRGAGGEGQSANPSRKQLDDPSPPTPLPKGERGVRAIHIAIVYGSDQSITAYRNGKPYGRSYVANSLVTFEPGKAQVVFGLRHSPPSAGKMLAGSIDRAALYDRALSADEIAASAGTVAEPTVSDDEILAGLTNEQRSRRNAIVVELSRLETVLRLWNGGPVYAVKPSAPDATHFLDRGNPAQKKDVLTPGAIRSVAGLSPEFDLPADASDAARRIKLAEWITNRKNPLTARVLVNRLWHYHFGTGIVDTPNDFGFNGGRPTHPELLDWLAAELVEPSLAGELEQDTKTRGHGDAEKSSDDSTPSPRPRVPASPRPAAWSLKHLHRLIVMSFTYRQASRHVAAAAKVDAGNRLLWRKTPVRLEAETLRDSMLAVAGELNPAMGGPGYQDFKTFTFNSQFYEMLDPPGFAFNRRTVYRTWVRSGRNEFLDVFDCPDPSTTSPKRAVTTTPLQALSLLNNSFLLRMSDRFAARLIRDAGPDTDKQIQRAYELAFGRPAEADEVSRATRFSAEHGLPALCRVLFNANEFLYVE